MFDSLANLSRLGRQRGRSRWSGRPTDQEWTAFDTLAEDIRAQCSHFPTRVFTTSTGTVWTGRDAPVLRDYRMGQGKLDFLQLAVFMGQGAQTPAQREQLQDNLRFWIASGLSPSRFCLVGTATGLSAYTGQPDLLALLAEAGADLFLTRSLQHGGTNETLLHRCVQWGFVTGNMEGEAIQAVVRFLDAHYAALGLPCPVDLQNQTPEEVARTENLPVLAAILEQARLARTFPAAANSGLPPRPILRL